MCVIADTVSFRNPWLGRFLRTLRGDLFKSPAHRSLSGSRAFSTTMADSSSCVGPSTSLSAPTSSGAAQLMKDSRTRCNYVADRSYLLAKKLSPSPGHLLRPFLSAYALSTRERPTCLSVTILIHSSTGWASVTRVIGAGATISVVAASLWMTALSHHFPCVIAFGDNSHKLSV